MRLSRTSRSWPAMLELWPYLLYTHNADTVTMQFHYTMTVYKSAGNEYAKKGCS